MPTMTGRIAVESRGIGRSETTAADAGRGSSSGFKTENGPIGRRGLGAV